MSQIKHLLVLDIESYYDQEVSLRVLSPPEYIFHPKFEVTLLAAYDLEKWPAPRIIDAADIPKFLAQYPPAETLSISHNALFDGAVLGWRYDWVPARMVDTLGMARALRTLPRYSLGAVAKALFGHDSKGDVIHKVKGLNAQGIKNAGLWPAYRSYSMQDALICAQIFGKLWPEFPAEERLIQDLVLRAAIEPVLHADVELLQRHLETIRANKAQLLNACGYDKAALMSTAQFQLALEHLNVVIGTKASIANPKKQIPAFAKTDLFMQQLLEHPDLRVQTLAAARLCHKSTIEETRAERFLNIAKLPWKDGPMLPVPLRYAAAHTHRFGGEWSMNMQNLPRDQAQSKLRTALTAPPGHTLIAADLSQIEARLVATLAGETGLVEAFRKGQDVYAIFASKVFGRSINKNDHPSERFIGKTCLAAGTLVCTNRGLVPIEDVKISDRVWDGENWVCHNGVVSNGLKPTLQLCGVWLTPDHLVWSGTQWKPADLLVTDENILSQALATAAASLPLPAICEPIAGIQKDFLRLSSSVNAELTNTQLTSAILRASEALGVTGAQNSLERKNVGGNTPKQCLTMSIEHDCLVDWLQQLGAAITQKIARTSTMAHEAFTWLVNGERIDRYFFNTSRLSPAGMIHPWIWTASTTIAATNQVISAFAPQAKICRIDEKSTNSKNESKNLKPVYDILNTGPKHRFLIYTDRGFLLVSNCILGLGYGCGIERFHRMVVTQARQFHIPGADRNGIKGIFNDDTAKEAVDMYRESYPRIPGAWGALDHLLLGTINNMYNKKDQNWPHPGNGPLAFRFGEIELPNKLRLRYRPDNHTLWGGVLLENCSQALARIIIMQAALRLYKLGYRWILQAHDELVFVVPDDEVDEAKAIILEEMIRPPAWLPELPLAAEVKVGSNYGAMKQ